MDEEAQVLLIALSDGHIAPEAQAVPEYGCVEGGRVEDVGMRVAHLLMLFGKVCYPPEVVASAVPSKVPVRDEGSLFMSI